MPTMRSRCAFLVPECSYPLPPKIAFCPPMLRWCSGGQKKKYGFMRLEPRNYDRRVRRVLGLGAAGAAGGEFVTFEGFVHFLAGLAIEVHLDFSPHATNSDAEDTLTGLHQVDNLAG